MFFEKGDRVKRFDENGNVTLEIVQQAQGEIVWLSGDLYWRDTGHRIGRTGEDDKRCIVPLTREEMDMLD